MDAKALQFSFLLTKADGTVYGSAIETKTNERFAYIISPEGEVHRRNEAFPFSRWYHLVEEESFGIRRVVSESLIPRHRA